MFSLVMQNHIGGCCSPFFGGSPRMNYYFNLAGFFAGLQNSMQMPYNIPQMLNNGAYLPYSTYTPMTPYLTSYTGMPIFNNYSYSVPTLSTPVFNYSCNSGLSYNLTTSFYSAPTIPSLSMPTIPYLTSSYSTPQAEGVSSKIGNYDKNSLPQIKNSSLMKNVPTAKKEKILAYVDKACQQYGVDPKLVISMMYAESGFDENATSPCGAAGLMQLMPGTAKQYGASDPYDIEQNINAAVKFIKYLKDRYNGNRDLMIAAYNAGPGKVKESVPNISETKNYVAKVNRTYNSLV